MQIRLFEAGKPEGARAVDATFTLESGQIALGGEGCQVAIAGLGPGALAEIRVRGEEISLKRAGDARVSVGGRDVASGAEVPLGVETLLSIGGKELVFRSSAVSASVPGEETERPSIMARDVLKQVFSVLGVPEGDLPALVVYDSAERLVKRLDFTPADEEVTIGRGSENRLVLYHPSVSKSHARVVRDGLGFLVYDLESRNGVEVNGERVRGKQRLKSGDRMRLGEFTVRFVDPKASVDLTSSVPDLRRIDKAKPGEKVVVGDKAAADVEETQVGLTPSGKHEALPAAPAAAAPAAGGPPAPPVDGGKGSGVMMYLIIGVGVVLLLGALAMIFLATTKT